MSFKKPKKTKKLETSKTKVFWSERVALFAALFFFAFGMGLIADGKKIYTHQLKLSQHVGYQATLSPYTSN